MQATMTFLGGHGGLFGVYLFIVAVHANCSSKWTLAYSYDDTGEALGGNKEELIRLAMSGAKVRVCSQNYCTSLQHLQTINNNLCGQTIFSISKDGFSTFQAHAEWWFSLLCTSGSFHMVRYRVGEHSSIPDTQIMSGTKWFVRKCEVGPLFSTTNDGTIIVGSLLNLSKAVDQASDIRLVHRPSGSAFALDNVVHNPAISVVSGQSLWEISQMVYNDIFIYQSNAYWVFKSYSTSGTEERHHWNIGEHKSRGNTTNHAAADWYKDDCWKFVYSHEENGTPVKGSRQSLLSALNEGHRVKMVFSEFSVEPDTVYIKANHVYGQILNNLGRVCTKLGSIDPDTHWEWKMVSTKGSVHTVKYKVGDKAKHAESEDSTAFVSWFVDDRRWNKVLETSRNGTLTNGSKELLVKAIREGSEVRLRTLSAPGSIISSVFSTADNLEINGVDVAAMHIRRVGIMPRTMKFSGRPYWQFSLTDTNGRNDISQWTVGTHEERGHNNLQTYGVVWFVNE